MSNTMKTREAVLSALKPAYNRRVMVTLARHLIRAAGPAAANTRAGRSGTYASRRISGITFALMPPLHTLAPELRAQQERVRAATAGLEARLGRPPRAFELASSLMWTLSQLFHAMTTAGAGGLRAGDPSIETLDSPRAAGTSAAPSRIGELRDRLIALAHAFFDLGEPEQLVLLMVGDRHMSREQVALVLGDSCERVGDLHDEAVAKLLNRTARHAPAPATHAVSRTRSTVQAVDARADVRVAASGLHKDGYPVAVVATVTPVYGPGGTIVGACHVSRLVTDASAPDARVDEAPVQATRHAPDTFDIETAGSFTAAASLARCERTSSTNA